MKSILLTSTALVAFAGAAAADGHLDLSTSVSGNFGYNSEVDGVGEDGFFWDGNVKITGTTMLDNGLKAGLYYEIDIAGEDGVAGNDDAQALSSDDFVLSLESDTASIFFGDTGAAAKKHWAPAGDMEQDGFLDAGDIDANVLRGDVTFGAVDASISYLVDDAVKSAEQLSFGASASFGAIDLAVAYQEEAAVALVTALADDDFEATDGSVEETIGVSAKGSFAGATVTLAYAESTTHSALGAQTTDSSTGVNVSYPIGSITLGAYYVDESNGDANTGVSVGYADGPIDVTLKVRDEQGRSEWNLEGSYDVGNGLTVLAGALNENEGDDVDFYVEAKYDLGGGASASFAYAVDEDGDQGDEIGAGEYDPGATIKLSFAF